MCRWEFDGLNLNFLNSLEVFWLLHFCYFSSQISLSLKQSNWYFNKFFNYFFYQNAHRVSHYRHFKLSTPNRIFIALQLGDEKNVLKIGWILIFWGFFLNLDFELKIIFEKKNYHKRNQKSWNFYKNCKKSFKLYFSPPKKLHMPHFPPSLLSIRIIIILFFNNTR